MVLPEGFTQFTCPLCGGDVFYLVRHEVDDIEALELIANGFHTVGVEFRRSLMPLYAFCPDCGEFGQSVSLIDHAIKIGATKWERVPLKAGGTEDERGQDQ